MTAIFSFALALMISVILVPYCRKYGQNFGLIDAPSDDRKVHSESVPRSGGIAIVCASLVGTALWLPDVAPMLGFILLALLIALFGLVDDFLDLSRLIKLAGQIIATLLFIALYGAFPQVPMTSLDSAPFLITALMSFLFLVGITNAVNLSDGLDGLAAGNCLLSLIILAAFSAQAEQITTLIVSLALAGGLLGFLRFNTHPASIFMGDTGSQFIGFTAAATTLLLFQAEALPFAAALPVLIFGLPILDTLSVMAIRRWRGRPMMKADRSHLHHQLLRLKLRHYEVVAVLYAVQGVSVGMAYVLRYQADWLILSAYAVFCAAIVAPIYWARTRGWVAHRNRGTGPERRNEWLRRLTWYHKNTARVLSIAAAGFFLFCAIQAYPLEANVASSVQVCVLLMGACMILFRNQFEMTARVTCYLASAAAISSLLYAPAQQFEPVWADGFVAVLGAALLLAIRVTRRNLFHLDTQDYLVLVIISIAPFLMPDDMDAATMTRTILYFAVLLYVSEYVITKGDRTRWLLSGAGLVSLAIVGAK